MHTTITVGQVLNTKGHDLWSIAPGATAYHALEIMADKNVGALLVMVTLYAAFAWLATASMS